MKNKKIKAATLLITCIIALNIMLLKPPVSAAYIPDMTGGVYEPEETEPAKKPSIIEQLLAAPINGLYEAMKGLGFEPYEKLIFGTSEKPQPGDAGAEIKKETSKISRFSEEEWYTIMEWYKALTAGSISLILLAIILDGYRFYMSRKNHARRAMLSEALWNWAASLLIIMLTPALFWLFIGANDALVDLFKSLNSANIGNSLEIEYDKVYGNSLLAFAIVKLGLLGLTIYFNILYMVRKLVIVSLVVFTPIMSWIWAISRSTQVVGIWAGEISSNIFMQSAHAFVLVIYLSIIQAFNSKTGFNLWWAQIVCMISLIAVSSMLRQILLGFSRFFGVNEEQTAGLAMGSLLGLGGLVGVGKMTAAGLGARMSTVAGDGSLAGLVTGAGTSAGRLLSGAGPGSGTTAATGAPAAHAARGAAWASSVAGVAGKIGRVAGYAIGAPIRQSETFARAGEHISSGVAGFAARPVGTAASIAGSVYRGGKETGSIRTGIANAMARPVPARDAGSPGQEQLSLWPENKKQPTARETFVAVGRSAGTVIGSALGTTGARAGAAVGGAAAVPAYKAGEIGVRAVDNVHREVAYPVVDEVKRATLPDYMQPRRDVSSQFDGVRWNQ